MNTILEHIQLWTTAQTPKTSGRGNRADNLQLLGIQKLRELILELAVRGKLVPQDPKDEPASVLLKKIETEKKRLIKEGKIKNQEVLPEVGDDEKSFDLPKGWEWVRLGNVSEFVNGFAFKSADFTEEGIGIVKIGDIQNGEVSIQSMSRVSPEIVKSLDDALKANKGDLLIAMSGATTGKLGFNRTNEIFYINQRVGKIVPHCLNVSYLFFPLTTMIADNLAKSMGSAIPNLSTAQIKDIVIALPPLAEQHRIVAKVDELMALCDQLEQQQTENNQLHQTLVETLLANLTQAGNPAEQEEAWQRISAHFDTLFTTEYSIDQLMQTILQLAVMGKLVPQNPADEPASELLKKIAKEKARLVKEGKINKQVPLPEITDDEKPFELPEGWEWVRFGSVIQELKYGTSKMCDYNIDGDPVLRIPNIVNGYLDSNDLKFTVLNENEKRELSLNEGDLLIIRSNGSVSIVGRSAIVDQGHIGYTYAGYLVRVRYNYELATPSYLKLLLDSRFVRDQIELPIRTTSGVKNINSTEISMLMFPFAPLAEQQRIVSKVSELFALCDALKERLAQAQTTQNLLAGAVVERALETKPGGKVVYATNEQMSLAAEPE